jgi:ABC-type hemin transport system substrate-binding protein
VGVASDTLRQRDRIVGRTSSTVGAHSSHTVLGVGSSIALSSELAVRVSSPLVNRSASSMTITCHLRSAGCRPARRTSSRMSSM